MVLVAGWISTVEGWSRLLRSLVGSRQVVYLESREKRSAELDAARLRPEAFTLERLAEDLRICCRQSRLLQGPPVLVGSSLGANVILEALKREGPAPLGAFLVGPNARVPIPRWGRAVIAMPPSVYPLLKHFLLWYLRTFLVDHRADPEQMRRYERTVNAAEPARLRMSAKAVLDYDVWPGLERIAVPVRLGVAPTDTLHRGDEARRIAALIPGASVVEYPSSTSMHTERVVEDIDGLVESARENAPCA